MRVWGNKNKKLIRAATKGHTKTVKSLLDKGADANAKYKNGSILRSYLHRASLADQRCRHKYESKVMAIRH